MTRANLPSLLLMFALSFCNYSIAQKIQYSRNTVFITNPNQLKLVANVAGTHHLLHLSKDENPTIFIFNKLLELTAKVKFPFSIPDRSEIRIIPFRDFYYLLVRTRFTKESFFWKIDNNGSFTNFTTAFNQLLISQSKNIKLGFQLIASQEQLWMVYHTDLDNLEQKTLVIAQADSLLNLAFTHRVRYNFKRDEERLQQEILMFGKHLLVLKTARSGTALELMKVNLATGYTISNTFATSGYFYSQASFNYNASDSVITLSALVTEPRQGASARQFIFVSRLNKILLETSPFAILKSSFLKNTGANFLPVDSGSQWMRIKLERSSSMHDFEPAVTVYQDLTTPGDNSEHNTADRFLANLNSSAHTKNPVDLRQNVRFSLFDRQFKILHDSLVINSRDAYTLNADQFVNFQVMGKEYLIVSQKFAERRKGLLMVYPGNDHQLRLTSVRVNERNNYLLGISRLVAGKGILIPYVYRNEAGLMQISAE